MRSASSVLAQLCPCATGDGPCAATHVEAALVIAATTWVDRDPPRAAALLLGVGAHETGFRTRRQARGGPARSWWQVEPRGRGVARRVDQDLLEADPYYAAGRALAAARGGMEVYACGQKGQCPEMGAELERYVTKASTLIWAAGVR